MEESVKRVFEELELENVYAGYEETTVTKIREMIEQVDESQGLKRSVFAAFLNKIYKRTK